MPISKEQKAKREAKVKALEDRWKAAIDEYGSREDVPTDIVDEIFEETEKVTQMDADIKNISRIDEWLELQALPVQGRLDVHDVPPYEQRREMSEDERLFNFGSALRSMAKVRRGDATKDDLAVLYPDAAGRQQGENSRSFWSAGTGANEETPADGGFLVGEDYANELLKRTYDTGVLASKTRRRRVSRNSNSVVLPGLNETSRADGSRHGGVRGYWVAEGGSLTASRPAFRRVQLTLNKLTMLYYATDELLEDASLLGQEVEQAFSEEAGFKLDDAIWNGTGTGQPKGVMNANALVSVTVSGTASSYDATDIIGAFARVYAPSMSRGEWYTNQDVIPNLHSMVLSVGSTIVPVYQPMNQFGGNFGSNPFQQTLYNRPLNFIEQAAANGVTKNLSFVDLSQYLLIDKGPMKRAMSIHVQFTTDETVFRWTYRVDGQPLWHSALTPFKGSNTQSPYVTLAT